MEDISNFEEVQLTQNTSKKSRVGRHQTPFPWKSAVVSFSLWLAIAIPLCIMWRNLYHLKVLWNQKQVEENGLLMKSGQTETYTSLPTELSILLISQSVPSFAESELSSTSTLNPLVELEEKVEAMLRESIEAFKRETRDKWQECRCAAGANGDIGEPGTPGPFLKGMKGYLGFDGPVGPPGLKGLKGKSGYNGFNGLKGEKGEYGFPGLKGIRGLDGLPGFTGLRGIDGDQGYKGLKGDTGNHAVRSHTVTLSMALNIFINIAVLQFGRR